MKYLRATKDYQIKILASLPRCFAEFVSERPGATLRVHPSLQSKEFPLFSATAPQQSMIASSRYGQLFSTRIFAEDAPDVGFDECDCPVFSLPNGYFAQYQLNLQAEPQLTLPERHFQQTLTTNERLLAGGCTTHGRVLYADGRILQLNTAGSVLKSCAEFLFGCDSDPLAQPPTLFRELLKTRNREFKSDKPARRQMKDEQNFADFSEFNELQKSVVQELEITREPLALSEERVVSAKEGVVLTDSAIYLLHSKTSVREKIPLSFISDALPGFAFLTHDEALKLRKEGPQPYGAQFYLLAHDCVTTTAGNCAVLCSLFKAQEDKCRLTVFELVREGRKTHLFVHSRCEPQKQMAQSALMPGAQIDQLHFVNAFFTDFPARLGRVLALSATQYRPQLLFAPSLSGLLYVCFDDEITQFSHTHAAGGALTVNDGDFYCVMQRLERMPELDRKRYCANIDLSFRRLAAAVYGRARLLCIGGGEAPGGICAQASAPGLFGALTRLFKQKITSLHFDVRHGPSIRFSELEKQDPAYKERTRQAVQFQEPLSASERMEQTSAGLLSRSVRFATAEAALASQTQTSQQAAPRTSGFCLLPLQQIQNNQEMLRNVISSQVCCFLRRRDRVIFVCAGFNGAARLRTEMVLAPAGSKSKAGTADAENAARVNAASAALFSAYKSVPGGSQAERAEVLLRVNFENYLRNETLLPMAVEEVLPAHIDALCAEMALRSVIGARRDLKWLGGFQRAQNEEKEEKQQQLIEQYKQGNFQKQQQFLLLVHFLAEIGLLDAPEARTAVLASIRTAFDACSGVAELLDFIKMTSSGEDWEVFEAAEGAGQRFQQHRSAGELRSTIGGYFNAVSRQGSASQAERNQMAQQKLAKLSDFEAALSNCAAQTGDKKVVFAALRERFLATADVFYAEALARYLQGILTYRMDYAEQLRVESIKDFPPWLDANLAQIKDVFHQVIRLEALQCGISLANSLLFLTLAGPATVDEFASTREQILSLFDNAKLNKTQRAKLAQVCCKFHDFRRFAALTCAQLQDVRFADFYRIQLYIPEYADLLDMLSDYLQSEFKSGCQAENFVFEKELFLPRDTLETILQCHKEYPVFRALGPVEDAFRCLLAELESRQLNARAMTLRVVLGEEIQAGQELCELRQLVGQRL